MISNLNLLITQKLRAEALVWWVNFILKRNKQITVSQILSLEICSSTKIYNDSKSLNLAVCSKVIRACHVMAVPCRSAKFAAYSSLEEALALPVVLKLLLISIQMIS